MRLAFFGTPDFSSPALQALLDAGHDVVAVYTQPPREARRGHRVHRTPVHELAIRHTIDVHTPATLKDPGVQAAFARLELDAAVVVAYGLLLPKPILEAPRLGCLNIHASLLPRWRGAAPIQRAILAGDRETGVTIMLMDEGLDTGPLLLQRSIPIDEETDAAALHDRLAALGAQLIVEALAGLAAGTLRPTPQPETGATYAERLSRDDGRLDWTQPADALARQVRAFHPWPGSWFEHGAGRIRVLAARAVTGARTAPPGTVVGLQPFTVTCGEGLLLIERLQRPGRKPVPAAAFLRGHPIAEGARLA